MAKRRRRVVRRRGTEKPWSKKYVSTGSGPSPLIMSEYRARSRYVEERYLHDAVVQQVLLPNEPRRLALERRYELQNMLPVERSVTVYEGTLFTDRMFYSSNYDEYFFVRVFHEEQIFQRSLVYPTRDMAMLLYKRKKLRWLESRPTFKANVD